MRVQVCVHLSTDKKLFYTLENVLKKLDIAQSTYLYIVS